MKAKIMQHNDDVRGFTLIEMSIILIIIGLILASIFPQLKIYKNTQRYNVTRDNVVLADEAVREFYGLNVRRYPCPADPTLAPDDVGYGQEQCRLTTADPCPANIECRNVGSRDADGDGVDDFVMIGALPASFIEANILFSDFSAANGYDGFNTKLLYAVTESMTKANANIQLGAINVRDEFNRDLTNPGSSAHYIIVSHGDNSKGGYNATGAQLVDDCRTNSLGVPTPPGPTIGLANIEMEIENCDADDAIFVSALRSIAGNDSYFDDQVIFRASTVQTLWERSPSSPGPPTPETWLYNTNFGNVGVGVNTPGVKLEVASDMRVQAAVQAENGVCEQGGGECIDPAFIGGTLDPGCTNPSEVADGVSDNALICDAVTFTGFSGANFTCPTPGEFVRAISNLGNVVCGVP